MKAPLLEVNTKTASRTSKSRFSFVPSGAKIDQFSKEDLQTFKRVLRWQRKHAIEKLLPNERVAKCFVVRIKPSVELHYSHKVKRAHYGGLMICGRVWNCPICAAKITERKRVELKSAKRDNLSDFMVTITLQHKANDTLEKLNDDLSRAWRMVTAGRGWQEIKTKYKLVGSVTGREVTYGLDNGWHPHLHILYFSSMKLEDIPTDEIRHHVSIRFGKALAKIGRYASPEHGVNAIKGTDVTNLYIAKVGLEDGNGKTWDLISEITKASAKAGMIVGDRYTPFQLVDLYLCGDLLAGKRFIQYAKAMKGKKQLTYSRGLRELLDIGSEATDQELAEAQDQEARLLAMLSPEAWRHVLKCGKRGDLLEVASSGDFDLFLKYCKLIDIEDLPERPT